jgi:transglutaminase-like putative cysteine protease
MTDAPSLCVVHTTPLRVVHTTRYAFDDVVPAGCVIDTHLEPRDHAFHQLVVKPLPAKRDRGRDEFGNARSRLTIDAEFQRLEVTAISTVVGDPPAEPNDTALQQPWEDLRKRAQGEPTLAQLREASPRVPLGPVADHARDCFAPGVALKTVVTMLLSDIETKLQYDAKATEVDTTLQQLLERRRGVCQDFAHLALACLRSHGLPARYVSGYIAKPGSHRTARSHAWLALWLGDDSWLELDPTLGRIGPLGHITLAWGRDYDDVAPVRGKLDAHGRCRMSTKVSIEAA